LDAHHRIDVVAEEHGEQVVGAAAVILGAVRAAVVHVCAEDRLKAQARQYRDTAFDPATIADRRGGGDDADRHTGLQLGWAATRWHDSFPQIYVEAFLHGRRQYIAQLS